MNFTILDVFKGNTWDILTLRNMTIQTKQKDRTHDVDALKGSGMVPDR